MTPSASTISDLPLHKLQAIARRLGDRSENRPTARIRPRNRAAGSPPLSYAQQRLWILNQVEQDNGAYNLASAIRFDAPLNEDTLGDTIGEIVRRHEILRTTFPIEDAGPIQSIAASSSIRAEIVDLTGLNEEAAEAVARELAIDQARRPFDLAQGPLVHVKAIRTAPAKHVLTLSFHHVVIDGWCSHLFQRELSTLYTAFGEGKPSPLPEFDVQYGDFAVWQRESLRGEKLEKLVSYWKNQLSGLSGLEFPTDRPRSTHYSYRGARQSRVLPAQLTRRIQEMTSNVGVTQFMTFLAAFQALLYCYTGQEDMSVGAPVANRTGVELEGLIGCFVNTLVFRTDLSGDPSFRDLLLRVRETCRGAYAHQDLPFEKLVDEVNPPREASRNPLFQHALNYNNTPVPFVMNDFQTGRLETGWFNAGTSIFEFTLTINPANPLNTGADEINCVMEYNTDLFDASTIERLLTHLQTLLEGAVENPDRRLSEMPILTPEENKTMLGAWNDTVSPYPKDRCMHEWFEQQVQRTPDAIALVDHHRRITYRGLNRRANRLARRMVALGVGPEVRVGICIKRSAELILGMLAVLKAGGGYVPLDSSYPRERLAVTLEDSDAYLLLADASVIDRLPERRPHTLLVDRETDATESGDNLPSRVDAGNLAYLIYTSGSTGRPKGVAIPHQCDSALIEWAQRTFSVEEFSGVLASSSICFDLSIFEIFATLAMGGRVIIAQNALELPELDAKNEVTLLNTVPSAMAELLRMQAVPGSIRTVNLAGEALPGHLVRQTYEGTLAGKVYNLYGPSEDTTFSTFALIEKDARTQPPIGRPLSQSRMYVLDGNQRPVPLGAMGELCIGGEKLARGYFGRPELTALRFIPNPWSEIGGERLYRTGDLAKYRADGTLDYAGRIDHQVKVRGFRIELGEVEAALRAHDGVKDVVVTATEGIGERKRLIGYVVEKRPGSAGANDLRRYLKPKLPEFMIPSAYVVLDRMPLNRNGKVDRRALPAPAPEARHLTPPTSYVAPRSELERSIGAIWQELLGVEEIALDENFFELGGNSLLMVQLRLKLRKVLNRDVPIMELFRNPTVASLAGSASRADESAEMLQDSSARGELRKDALKKRRMSRQPVLSAAN